MDSDQPASETLFRLAFHASPDSINVNRLADGLYVDINQGFTDLTGYTREEVVGRSSLELDLWADPRDRERLVALLRRDGAVNNLEARFRLKDGRVGVGLMSARILSIRDVPHILSITRDITERQQTEDRLRETSRALEERERLYRMLFESAAHANLVSCDGCVVDINTHGLRMFGRTRGDLVGARVEDLSPTIQPGGQPSAVLAREHLERARATGIASYEWRYRRLDESTFDAEVTLTPAEVSGKMLTFATVRDIGDRRRLEAQLLQAQKMEAVGRLAGGVAHDFNNMLTAILGYSDIVSARLVEIPLDEATREELRINIAEIARAADRAAGLTRQLLAFSRRQVLEPRMLEPNVLVRDLDRLLRRLIGEDIEILTVLDPQVGTIYADPGQIEQVLVNLAVNARDAMPRGGRLTIETANVDLGESATQELYGVPAGRYVRLAVSDTGIGMTGEALSHLFEPFYTTKERGKGTGLGLATVYGIVKQSGGHITVYSEPGLGSTFRVYLPRTDAAGAEAADDTPRAAAAGGRETILLVEDEELVRTLQARVLAMRGYQVLTAHDAREAERCFDEAHGHIHLLITDVVMPGVNGRQLADRLLARHPLLRVLYLSGYTENAIVHAGVLDPGVNFLPKPCSADTLAREVRRILDEPPREQAPS